MQVHPVVLLLGQSGEVRQPEGRQNKQEERQKVEMALFEEVPFQLHEINLRI